MFGLSSWKVNDASDSDLEDFGDIRIWGDNWVLSFGYVKFEMPISREVGHGRFQVLRGFTGLPHLETTSPGPP